MAASAGAYLHGKAGEIAKEQLGAGLLATDIIESVPKVIKDLILNDNKEKRYLIVVIFVAILGGIIFILGARLH